jgi:hypothetical protein
MESSDNKTPLLNRNMLSPDGAWSSPVKKKSTIKQGKFLACGFNKLISPAERQAIIDDLNEQTKSVLGQNINHKKKQVVLFDPNMKENIHFTAHLNNTPEIHINNDGEYTLLQILWDPKQQNYCIFIPGGVKGTTPARSKKFINKLIPIFNNSLIEKWKSEGKLLCKQLTAEEHDALNVEGHGCGGDKENIVPNYLFGDTSRTLSFSSPLPDTKNKSTSKHNKVAKGRDNSGNKGKQSGTSLRKMRGGKSRKKSVNQAKSKHKVNTRNKIHRSKRKKNKSKRNKSKKK